LREDLGIIHVPVPYGERESQPEGSLIIVLSWARLTDWLNESILSFMIPTPIDVCIHEYVFEKADVHTRTRTHTQTHTHTHTHTDRARTNTQTHTHTPAHAHTHTHRTHTLRPLRPHHC